MGEIMGDQLGQPPDSQKQADGTTAGKNERKINAETERKLAVQAIASALRKGVDLEGDQELSALTHKQIVIIVQSVGSEESGRFEAQMSEVRSFLGVDLSDEEVDTILRRMGFVPFQELGQEQGRKTINFSQNEHSNWNNPDTKYVLKDLELFLQYISANGFDLQSVLIESTEQFSEVTNPFADI